MARQAAQDAVAQARQSEAARTPTAEHTADLQRLRLLEQHREQLTRQHQAAARAAQQTRAELKGAPRWARTRRRNLTAALSQYIEQQQQQPAQLVHLDAQISQVRNRLDVNDRQWNARRDADRHTPVSGAAAVPDPLGKLTPTSRPTRPAASRSTTRLTGWPTGWLTRPALDPRTGVPSRLPGTGPYRPEPQPEQRREGGGSR